MKRLLIYAAITQQVVWGICGSDLTANEVTIQRQDGYLRSLGINMWGEQNTWYKFIDMSNGCPVVDDNACKLYKRYQADGNTMNASEQCPTQLIKDFWIHPLDSDIDRMCGGADTCWNSSIRGQYEGMKNQFEQGVFDYSAAGPFRYNYAEKIEIRFTPCSLFYPGGCRWPYMRVDDPNFGANYISSDYKFVGTLSTTDEVGINPENFPFKITQKLVKNSKGKWVPIQDDESIIAKEPSGELAHLPKGAAYIELGYQNHKGQGPNVTMILRPDHCTQDAIYKIETTSNTLYINGKTPARSNVWPSLLYVNEATEARCERDEAVLTSPIKQIEEYYKSNCPGGSGCFMDFATGKTGIKCRGHWDEYLIAEHKYNPRVVLGGKVHKWYINIPGDPAGRDCTKSSHIDYDDTPIFIDFSTLAKYNSLDSFSWADMSSFGSQSFRDATGEYLGILTRFAGDSIALKFDIPTKLTSQEGSEAFLLMIDDGTNSDKWLYNYAGYPAKRYVGDDRNDPNLCKAPDGRTCKEAYAANSNTAEFYNIHNWATDTTSSGFLKRQLVLFFNNVKPQDTKKQHFIAKLIFVDIAKTKKDSDNRYLELAATHAREIPHAPLTVRPREFNLPSSIDFKPLASNLVTISSFVNTPSMIPAGTIIDKTNAAGKYFIDHGQYVIEANGDTYRFYDKPFGAQSWQDASRISARLNLVFPGMPRDMRYFLKDKTLPKYLNHIGILPDSVCRDDDESDITKANSFAKVFATLDTRAIAKIDKQIRDLESKKTLTESEKATLSKLYDDKTNLIKSSSISRLDGKISCNIPGSIKLDVFSSPKGVKLKETNSINLDANGKSNAWIANNKFFRARLDFYKQYVIDDATNPDLLPVAYEADSAWNFDIDIKPLDNLVEYICNDKDCTCLATGSCASKPLVTTYSIAANEQNKSFYDWLDKLCTNTRCNKGNTDYATAKSYKTLLKDYYDTKTTREFLVIPSNNPLSVISNTGPISVSANLEPDEVHHKVFRLNYLMANENAFETQIAKYPKVYDPATKDFERISMHAITPYLAIKDQKIKCTPTGGCSKSTLNEAEASAQSTLFYKDETGTHRRVILQNGCDTYEKMGNACYNIAKHQGQYGGSIGFESDSNVRPEFKSTYGNTINFTGGQYEFKTDKASGTYTKDIIRCSKGMFSCKDFSVEIRLEE